MGEKGKTQGQIGKILANDASRVVEYGGGLPHQFLLARIQDFEMGGEFL